MAIAQSKITSQGQISIPADIRRRLGVGPGSILDWEEDDGKIVSIEEGNAALDPTGAETSCTRVAHKK